MTQKETRRGHQYGTLPRCYSQIAVVLTAQTDETVHQETKHLLKCK